jgi:hypothetical protein
MKTTLAFPAKAVELLSLMYLGMSALTHCALGEVT